MPRFDTPHLARMVRAAGTLARLAPVLDARGTGRRKRSLRQVAALLNDAGFPTRSGGQWWPEGVRRAVAAAERARGVLTGG